MPRQEVHIIRIKPRHKATYLNYDTSAAPSNQLIHICQVLGSPTIMHAFLLLILIDIIN